MECETKVTAFEPQWDYEEISDARHIFKFSLRKRSYLTNGSSVKYFRRRDNTNEKLPKVAHEKSHKKSKISREMTYGRNRSC